MNVYVVLGIVILVAVVGQLLVGFQLKERLDKIASLLEKK
jgi:hypothetical protein